MSRFLSLLEYEQFIYNLPQDFPAILRSTLVLINRQAARLIKRLELEARWAT